MFVYEEMPTRKISYLSYDDRKRLLLAGALASEQQRNKLYKYLLPNGKVYAVEKRVGDRIVLSKTYNTLSKRKA